MEYINKTEHIYCVVFTKLPSTKKNKRHNILIKAESSALI